jgi:hypothetical protein
MENQDKLRISELENEVMLLKEKLKQYTAPSRSKRFYENHKEEIKEKSKEYKKRTNYDANIPKDKKREYNQRAYQKRKEKQKTADENILS